MAKVLIVDDDYQLLRMISIMLERGEHTPIIENNPLSAIARIQAEQPDLLILDVMMPSVNGHDLCREIRATDGIADLPILILTARTQEIDRETALESGADDYLGKPVTLPELLERVENLLDGGSSNPPGLIISLFGMRGGVGRTTLATNLAVALRRVGGEAVCLVDLSPSGGQVSAHLRLQARSSWGNLPALDELDWPTVEEQLMIHQSSGLYVLAAPDVPQSPLNPTAKMTAGLLALLCEQMRLVVVDLPPVLNPAVQAALTTAHMVFHVVAPEVISVKQALHTSHALANLNIKPKNKAYILNQTMAEMPLSAETVEKGLKSRLAFKIGFDPQQARAVVQGMPITLSETQSPLSSVANRIASVMWRYAVDQGQFS